MPDAAARIDELIYRLEEAASSEANEKRFERKRRAVFNIEEPIAWAKLFSYDVHRYFTDPAFYVEQTLRQKLWRWEHFPLDQAPLTLDMPAWLSHYPEYTYAGMEVEFNAEGVPCLQEDHPLSREADLSLLHPVDFYDSGWMPRVLQWYDDIRALVDERLPVLFNMFWWRGCLDLAIQLRGYTAFLADTMERPTFVHDLLRFLTEQRCQWHEAYARHFGVRLQPANIGDDWINIPFIAPGMFADFVLPRYLEIEAFHGGISYIHSCGNQAPVQQYLLEIQSLPVLEVSPWTDLDESLRNIPPSKRLAISLHPNDVLCATSAEMDRKMRSIIRKCQGRDYYIVTSGLTPLSANAGEFIDSIRRWTAVAQIAMDDAEEEPWLPSKQYQ